LLEAQEVFQYGERPLSAVILDPDDFRHPVGHLQFLGRDASAALEEPTIQLHLNDDFRVNLRFDAARHLAVSNHVAVAIEDQEVGCSDNLNVDARDPVSDNEGGWYMTGTFLAMAS
jgi:hypothetical protein